MIALVVLLIFVLIYVCRCRREQGMTLTGQMWSQTHKERSNAGQIYQSNRAYQAQALTDANSGLSRLRQIHIRGQQNDRRKALEGVDRMVNEVSISEQRKKNQALAQKREQLRLERNAKLAYAEGVAERLRNLTNRYAPK